MQVLSCLPLADGYTAVFRNFEFQTQKVKLRQIKVVGAESVTVAAGTFDAFKAELTPAAGGPEKAIIWIAKDSRKVLKISASMAGGASLEAELQ